MKTSHTLLLKSGFFASVISLIHAASAGQDTPFSIPPGAATSQFEVQYSRADRRSAAASAPMPRPIRWIIGTEAASISERVKAVHGLGLDLSHGEIAVLCTFVQTAPPAGGTNLEGLVWIKNDVLNALRDQSAPPPGLTRLLIELYRDKTQNSVLRDYAIQHLVLWYEQGAAGAPKDRESIRAVLREAVTEAGPLAGTALLGWHRLSRSDPSFDSASIDQLALQLAKSAGTDNATRLTAIQICADRGLTAALPVIGLVAKTTDCVPLRLSAAAAAASLEGAQPSGAEPVPKSVARVASRQPLRPWE